MKFGQALFNGDECKEGEEEEEGLVLEPGVKEKQEKEKISGLIK